MFSHTLYALIESVLLNFKSALLYLYVSGKTYKQLFVIAIKAVAINMPRMEIFEKNFICLFIFNLFLTIEKDAIVKSLIELYYINSYNSI